MNAVLSRLFRFACLGLVFSRIAGAAEAPPPSSGGLAQIVQPYVDNQTISGSVILVASRDRILDLETVGFADLATKRPMTADTIFGIASMGKPMAAAAVMMLVDVGKVKVDDPVEKYLPEFKGQMVIDPKDPAHAPHAPKHPATIRNMLTHTSGLPYSTPEEKPTLDGHPLPVAAAIYGRTPLEFEPDSRYQYSSAGINTAAHIVEVVSGLPYEEFMKTRLFGPLGMKDTTFWPTEEQLQGQAIFYKANAARTGLEPAQPVRFTFPLSDHSHRYPIPGSGLFSTAPDIVRFCEMMINGGVLDGKRYLSEAAIAQMTSKQTPPAVTNNYGFGWQVMKDGFGHGGSFKTFMEIYPRQNLILISLEQIDGGWPNQGGDKIFSKVAQAAKAKFGSAAR